MAQRQRALQSEIAALEARIKALDGKRAVVNPSQPRTTPIQPAAPQPAGQGATEPIFERVDQNRLHETPGTSAPNQFNELGLRKYDLAALFGRWRKHFFGPPVSNPRLVNYLAAGSVQGLRSLRFEKRIARNRFITWAIVFFVIVFGTLAAIMRHR